MSWPGMTTIEVAHTIKS